MLVQFGFFVAWVYLRFFKLSENGDFRGDRSETFAFQYWFPPPIRFAALNPRSRTATDTHDRPYIAIAGNHVYKVAVRVGLVQAWEEPAGYSVLPGPGQARAEAERRRSVLLCSVYKAMLLCVHKLSSFLDAGSSHDSEG